MRLHHLFPLLLLTACLQAQEWDIFSDRAFNIVFAHDPAYVRDEEIGHGLEFEGRTLQADSIALRKGQGEAAFIGIMQTKDPAIVSYLSSQSLRSERVSVQNRDVQLFHGEGMGDALHYLFRVNDLHIVLSFVFPPSQGDIDRVLHSVTLRP